MGFISAQGLKNLESHKYRPGQYTWLDYKMYKYFWTPFVELIPLWIAPNMLTFLGLIFQTSIFAVMHYYDPEFNSRIPNWVFFLAAFCVFAHQTLDAIDGLQARRTKNSSPIGQILDHSFDAVSIFFIHACLSYALGIQSTTFLIMYTLTKVPNWIAELYEYLFEVHMYQQSNIGPTEGEFTLIVVYLITGLFGQEFWYIYKVKDYLVPSFLHAYLEKLPFGHYFLNEGFYLPYTLFVGFGCFVIILQGFYVIFKNAPGRKKEIFTICSPMVYIILVEAVWEYYGFFSLLPMLSLLGFGMLYALNNFKLIISMTIKETPRLFYVELLIPIIFGAILYVMKNQYGASVETLRGIVLVHLLVEVLVLFSYYVIIIGEMAAHLKIPVFTIKKKKD